MNVFGAFLDQWQAFHVMNFDRQNVLLHVYGTFWKWGFLEILQFFGRFTRLSIAPFQENYRRSILTRIEERVVGFRF